MILHLIEQGTVVGIKRARLEVRKGGQTLDTYRLETLKQVALFGNIQVSTQAIQALLQHDVEIAFLSYSGVFHGRLVPHCSNFTQQRYLQYKRLEQPEVALQLAKACIHGKLHNQRVLLLRAQRSRQSETIANALLTIRMSLERLPEVDNLDTLRGLEGSASTAYFGVFGELFTAPYITFTKRIRRPPPDPVNILLSFGYTLLAHLVEGYVELAHLDPGFGALHQMAYGRPCLALDLMEEWRTPLVDSSVLRAINTLAVRSQDFFPLDVEELPETQQDQDESETTGRSPARKLLLTSEGVKRWLTVYERRLQEKVYYPYQKRRLSYRQIIREQIYRAARFLRDEEESYEPFLYPD